jgi:hypothetical protein
MTVKHGYSPIHPPRKHVSQEEMWTTLAKHAKANVEVKVTAMPLEWLKPVRTGSNGSGYLLSQCGRFSVTKDVMDDEKTVTYTAWSRATPPPANLGCVSTKEEAIAIAQADADAKAAP